VQEACGERQAAASIHRRAARKLLCAIAEPEPRERVIDSLFDIVQRIHPRNEAQFLAIGQVFPQ
jgi:hypothetical protein